jgi:hypothetical protein
MALIMALIKIKKWVGFLAFAVLFAMLAVFCASAETDGIFTYTVVNDEVTITKVDYSDVNDIVIPETLGGNPVTAIGDRCFYDNTLSFGDNADTVHIPKTVKTIIRSAFTYADIKRIIVDKDNPYYASDDYGVLFNKDMTELLNTGCAFDAGVYSIPNTVKTIADRAFHSCLFVEEYFIPSSVETIQSQAFWENQSLKRVHFSEGLQRIADNCFVWCNQLETIVLPSTITDLSYGAFTECYGLKEVIISEGITDLGRITFESDTALERVYLPSSLRSIGSGVFGNCSALTDVCYAGSAEDWANVSINTASYSGSRPVVIDTCSIHYDVPAEAYKEFSYENDNDILTFSGSGTIPSGWHYWDVDKATVTTVFLDGDSLSVDEAAFTDYPELAMVILDTETTAIADGAFANCPNLQAVLCFGGSSFGADAFDFEGVCKVYENANATHTFTASQDDLLVVPYRFAEGTLQLLADVNYGSYEFFDTMAAFTLEYDNIQKLAFQRFTFDSIPMYYYPNDGSAAVRIEDNTLVNGDMYPMIYLNGEATAITFNALVNGLTDKSITSFNLICADEAHTQIKDTPVTVKDDTESGFISTIKKAMRWVITLLNKLFKILGKK